MKKRKEPVSDLEKIRRRYRARLVTASRELATANETVAKAEAEVTRLTRVLDKLETVGD